MAGRRTNLALFVLLVGAFASGVAMWAVGSGWSRWATIVHGVTGIAFVAMSPWKTVVSRRGMRRRGLTAAVPGLGLAFLVVLTLASGFLHRAGVREVGPVLVMQIHVAGALAALPLVLSHTVSRRVGPRVADLHRRVLLRSAVLAGGSTVLTLALPHAGRDLTRSLERGSFRPPAMPVTQWLLDEVPTLDARRWRLQVGDRAWSREELERLMDVEVLATLDCTGGWYAHQRWSGIRIDRLLDASATAIGRSIEVRSVTGYSRRFPLRDAPGLVLATKVDGEPLSVGHGFPARLVATNRRGFWWVKWVVEIRIDQRPWWWQPPFPLD